MMSASSDQNIEHPTDLRYKIELKMRERKVMGREVEGTANGTECDAAMTDCNNDEQRAAIECGPGKCDDAFTSRDHRAWRHHVRCKLQQFDISFVPFFAHSSEVHAYAYLKKIVSNFSPPNCHRPTTKTSPKMVAPARPSTCN
jgi:hypothetical protein